MPFEPGNKLAPGGARDGSGRKPDELRRELQELFEKNCSLEKRGEILEMMTIAAKCGNVKAASFLYDRYYGKVGASDVTELVAQMQEFMDDVTQMLLAEVEADTRERILTRLRAARPV